MTLSQLARSIPESPTLRLNEVARRLRQRGEPVVNLGIGEPMNKAPVGAILSTSAVLGSGNVKYTPTSGVPSLKKAIIGYTEENYGRLVAPENIIVCSGAKQALFNLFFALLDPQDEVILLAPYWVSYPEMVKMIRGVPVIVRPGEGTFYVNLGDIEKKVTSRTKAVILNSPNNPSGAVYPEAFVSDVVGFCEKRGITLIADDIYHKLVFDGKVAAPAYRFTDRDVERTRIVVINGVSKTYGMTGFRVGWVVASKDIIEVMTNVQTQTTSCTSLLSQAGAEGALTGDQGVVESLRLTIQNNRDVVMQELRTFRGVKAVKPEGAFYCLPDFRAYSDNSEELARFLLEKALVVTIPGSEFGMEGHLRLSYAGSVKDVTEGIARLKWALDPQSPSEVYIGERRLVRDWL